MKKIIGFILFAAPHLIGAAAQHADLANCLNGKSQDINGWTACYGEGIVEGRRYIGNWLNGKPDGRGLIEIDKNIFVENIFKDGVGVEECKNFHETHASVDEVIEKISDGEIYHTLHDKESLYFEGVQRYRVKNTRKLGDYNLSLNDYEVEIYLTSYVLKGAFKSSYRQVLNVRNYYPRTMLHGYGASLLKGVAQVDFLKELQKNIYTCSELRRIEIKPDYFGGNGNETYRIYSSQNPQIIKSIEFSIDSKKALQQIKFEQYGLGVYKGVVRLSDLKEIYDGALFGGYVSSSLRAECLDCATIDSSISVVTGYEPLTTKKIAEIDFKSIGYNLQQDGVLLQNAKQALIDGDGSDDSKTCKRRGLKPNTPKYDSCRVNLVAAREAEESRENEREQKRQEAEYANFIRAEEARIRKEQRLEEQNERRRLAELARNGDGSEGDLWCKSHGIKPTSRDYKECRRQIDQLLEKRREIEALRAQQHQQAIDDARARAEERRIQNEREEERMRREDEREARAEQRRKNQALINLGIGLMGGAAAPSQGRSRSMTTLCHLQGSYISGMYKTCNYRCPGGVVPRSIGAAEICDLSIER